MTQHTHNNCVFSAGLFILLLLSQSCAENTPGTIADNVRSQLTAGLWKVQSVMVDGVNQDALFNGMTLKFDKADFTSTNGGAVWPVKDGWKLTDAQGTAFVRNDGIVVTIQSLSDASLILSLTWTMTTLGNGKVSSIPGQYVFTFGL